MTGPSDPISSAGQPTTTGSQPPRMLAGALAAVIIGVLAWLALSSGLFGGDADPTPTAAASPSAPPSDEPTAEPSPTPEPSLEPTEAPTVTPAPSAEARPFDVTWTSASGIDPASLVSGVKFIDGRWIALGSVPDNDSYEAAIWFSDDGASWEQARIDSLGGPNEASNASDVVELDGTLVAIGQWGILNSDQRAWVTWTSTDGGVTWSESRDGPEFGALSAIATGDSGLLAAGWTYAGTTPFDTYFVTSSDGSTWERKAATLLNAQVRDVVVIGDRFVAVGSRWVDDMGAMDAAAWYSDDGGESWTPVDVPDSGASLEMVDLVPFGDGLASIGTGGDTPPGLFISAAWVTVDGQAWDVFEVASGARSGAIGAVDGGLVGVGNFAAHDIGPGLAWTSTDAATWLEGSQPLGNGSVRLTAVAGAGDVVVAGGECQSTTCDTVIWIGQVTPRP